MPAKPNKPPTPAKKPYKRVSRPKPKAAGVPPPPKKPAPQPAKKPAKGLGEAEKAALKDIKAAVVGASPKKENNIRISLSQTCALPDVWPPEPSETSSLLSEAVAAITTGKVVSEKFMAKLRATLTSVEEKAELIRVLSLQHSAGRLQKLLRGVEMVEAIALNPKQLEQLDPDQLLRLMNILYVEIGSLNKAMMTEGPVARTNPAELPDVVDPGRHEQEAAALEATRDVPAVLRRKLRDALLKGFSEAAIAVPRPAKRAK
jgi:hypothetical protein